MRKEFWMFRHGGAPFASLIELKREFPRGIEAPTRPSPTECYSVYPCRHGKWAFNLNAHASGPTFPPGATILGFCWVRTKKGLIGRTWKTRDQVIGRQLADVADTDFGETFTAPPSGLKPPGDRR